MIMCVLLCYPVSIRIYYQQGGLFLVLFRFLARYRPGLRDRGTVNGTQTGISGTILVLVSNDNMHIDIKPYFCLSYRSILKYRGIRCFPGRDLPNSFVRFSISRNVNKYGVSGLAVSES